MFYWNILDQKRIDLLKEITSKVDLANFYLGGGTCLSLQLGLRESVDFDFFSLDMFNNNILLDELKKIDNIKVIQNIKGTCDISLNDVQISFFYYPNKILDNFTIPEELPNLKLASVLDIATMKVAAISGRGAKKDFFDLYHILKDGHVTLEQLTNSIFEKFGKEINYKNILMSFTYFEDAENELLPKCFVNNNWEEIKQFFTNITPFIEKEFIKINERNVETEDDEEDEEE